MRLMVNCLKVPLGLWSCLYELGFVHRIDCLIVKRSGLPNIASCPPHFSFVFTFRLLQQIETGGRAVVSHVRELGEQRMQPYRF